MEDGNGKSGNTGDAEEETVFARCVRNALRRQPAAIAMSEACDKAEVEGAATASGGDRVKEGVMLYSIGHPSGGSSTLLSSALRALAEGRVMHVSYEAPVEYVYEGSCERNMK